MCNHSLLQTSHYWDHWWHGQPMDIYAIRHVALKFGICFDTENLTYLVTILRQFITHVFLNHDDVIKWKHFPRNWPFVREIHRSPVNFPHKGQWRGALMFSLIYAWINDWVNNREAGDLRRQHGHYDVIVMMHFSNTSTKTHVIKMVLLHFFLWYRIYAHVFIYAFIK